MANVKKGILTQGTEMYIKYPALAGVFQLHCAKSIEIGDDSFTEIDTTCLDDIVATSRYGLRTPAEGSISIELDTENGSHIQLLYEADNEAEVEIAVAYSDGTDKPTWDDTKKEIVFPNNRSGITFQAILNLKSPTIEPNSVIKETVSFKRQTTVKRYIKGFNTILDGTNTEPQKTTASTASTASTGSTGSTTTTGKP